MLSLADERGTLIVEDAVLAHGFTQIPNYVLKAHNLSRDAKLLYGILLSYAWQKDACWPGYAALIDDLQCGPNQLSKWIKELKAGGYIDVKRRGQGKTSLYVIKRLQNYQNDSSGTIKTAEPVLPKCKHEEDSMEKDSMEKDLSNLRVVPTKKKVVDNSGADRRNPRGHITVPLETRTIVSQELHSEALKSSAASLLCPGPEGSPFSPTPSEYGPQRQRIVDYIVDFAREFNDAAPAKSSVTRAVNLFHRSGLALDDFCEKLYAARAVVKERTAAIKTTTTEPGKPFPTKRKMGYFFAVLEDTLGLRGQARTAGDD